MTLSREDLLARLRADRDDLIAFMRGFLQAPSANPPGDTWAAVDHITGYLAARQLPHRIVAGQPHLPNIVGSFAGSRPGRHLVLNGHIDVFPPNDERGWSGDLRDGKLFGRGASDMKTGTAASVFAFAYLHGLRDQLHGRLTLTAVSDEQTGGRWGTRYLFETIPDEVTGDCCLNGEPSGINNIRFMEKGTVRVKIDVTAPGGHGGYPHLSANPVKIASAIVMAFEKFHMVQPPMPADITAALTTPEAIAATNKGMGEGAAEIVRAITVNPGVMQGGQKINQIPHACHLEVDFRLPIGVDREAFIADLRAIVAGHPGTAFELVEAHSYPASVADPNGEMVGILQNTVEQLKGFRPLPLSSLGGSDSRYWRYAGIPAYLYGPSPVSMGRWDEHVTVDEFLHIVETHVLAAFAYLSRG